jgi:hypothetical protein
MKALENVLLMVLILIRLSNDLGSNFIRRTFDVLCAQKSRRKAREFVSEHSCVLVIFGIKNSGSRPKTLKFVCRDMPGWFRYKFRLPSIFSSRMNQEYSWRFLQVRAFFSMNKLFFSNVQHVPCVSCIKCPKFLGCVGSTPWLLASLWKSP